MKDFWGLLEMINKLKFIRIIFLGAMLIFFSVPHTFPATEDSVEMLLNKADSVDPSISTTTDSASDKNILAVADQLTHEYNMAQQEFKLYECILLAVFALTALLIVLGYLHRRPGCNARNMVNASGLVFIIFGTLFLVLLADADEQLNAAIGIMGAVAGYLFGTMKSVESGRNSGSE